VSIYSNPRGAAAANAKTVVQALLDLLGDRPAMDVLAETPGWLTERLRGVPDQRLRQAEAPGKWSVGQVLAHLADSELVMGFRSRLTVGDVEPPLAGFDQDRWATEFRYADQDPAVSLADFCAFRAANLRHWERLSPDQWERMGRHAERGPVTAALNARIAAGHDLVHRLQVQRILAGQT
jgi:hypothetical protein